MITYYWEMTPIIIENRIEELRPTVNQAEYCFHRVRRGFSHERRWANLGNDLAIETCVRTVMAVIQATAYRSRNIFEPEFRELLVEEVEWEW